MNNQKHKLSRTACKVKPMKVRAHIFVSGRVQGVFFRSEAKYEAEKRGVKGWIRNLRDCRVEAVLEGEEEAVKEIVEFCKRGPSGARIMHVDVTWGNYTGRFKVFEVRYDS